MNVSLRDVLTAPCVAMMRCRRRSGGSSSAANSASALRSGPAQRNSTPAVSRLLLKSVHSSTHFWATAGGARTSTCPGSVVASISEAATASATYVFPIPTWSARITPP